MATAAPRSAPAPKFTGTVKNGSGLIRKVAEAPEGNRHDALVWACYRAHHDGILDEIADDLINASVASGYPEASARYDVDWFRRKAVS